jgi:hypothetical protein
MTFEKKEPTLWELKEDITEVKTVVNNLDTAIRGNGEGRGIWTRIVVLETRVKVLIGSATIIGVAVLGLLAQIFIQWAQSGGG